MKALCCCLLLGRSRLRIILYLKYKFFKVTVNSVNAYVFYLVGISTENTVAHTFVYECVYNNRSLREQYHTKQEY